MIFKNYRELAYSDIERLVENKIPESKFLDYKQEINVEKGDERKEFLYDVSSFANTEGGMLIYGVSELRDEKNNPTGLSSKISGLSNLQNSEKVILQLEDLINSSIEPNIPNITIKKLNKEEISILIIGIPKPYGLPRMVTYNATNKFYKRGNSGKYLLDVYELNQLFMADYEMFKSANEFKMSRIKNLVDLTFLPNLDTTSSAILHLIPLSFRNNDSIDLTSFQTVESILKDIHVFGSRSGSYRHNYEGLLFYSDDENNLVFSYSQLFRNGILEFYSSRFRRIKQGGTNSNHFFATSFEKEVIDAVKFSLKFYDKMNILPPFTIMITLINFKKTIIFPDNLLSNYYIKENLHLPSLSIENYNENIEKLLKSVFDVLWQSAGYRSSPNYNDKGEYINR
jgi:hypothetical protein